MVHGTHMLWKQISVPSLSKMTSDALPFFFAAVSVVETEAAATETGVSFITARWLTLGLLSLTLCEIEAHWMNSTKHMIA